MLKSVDFEETPEKHFAIGLTWHITGHYRNQFRKEVRSKLLPSLSDLQSTMKVTMVLSLRHAPLKIQGVNSSNPWTDYLLIFLAFGVDPKETWKLIECMVDTVAKGIPKSLLRVEVLQPQKMPMVFPNMRLRHVMEYSQSKPDKQAEYYNDQYVFSGPVIQRFLEEGAVGSFIGLERLQYLRSNTSIPEWDVIHITGFKWRWLIKILLVLYRNAPSFHDIAREIGYKSGWGVLKSWDAKREKFLRVASQDTTCTLLSLRRVSGSHNAMVETPL